MLKFNHYCQHGRVASRTVLALFCQGIFDIATPHRRREGPSQYHILSHSAHTILAKASLSVLLALDDQVNEDSMQNYPLAVYAARYWVEHAQVHDIDYSFRETMFTANPSPPTATPLYYATLCGFRDLVQHLTVTPSRGHQHEGRIPQYAITCRRRQGKCQYCDVTARTWRGCGRPG